MCGRASSSASSLYRSDIFTCSGMLVLMITGYYSNMPGPIPPHPIPPHPIPPHLVHVSQAYLFCWTGIALAACIGAWDKYAGGPVSTIWLARIGTFSAGVLCLGLLFEYANIRVGSSRKGCLDATIGKIIRHRIPDRGTHLAVQLLTICSTGIAFVNMHTETWDWQFGMSACLLAMVFVYNVMYTPTILVSAAAYNWMDDSARKVFEHVHATTPYMWKDSYVADRLLPASTI